MPASARGQPAGRALCGIQCQSVSVGARGQFRSDSDTQGRWSEDSEEAMAIHRDLTFEDYVAILRRRRWLLIIPAILGAAAGYLISLVLPSRYTSHTMVLVEQPAVPDSYVKPVVNEDLNQRLSSMQEQILCRTRLQTLVVRFGPKGKHANPLPMKDVVARLRT